MSKAEKLVAKLATVAVALFGTQTRRANAKKGIETFNWRLAVPGSWDLADWPKWILLNIDSGGLENLARAHLFNTIVQAAFGLMDNPKNEKEVMTLINSGMYTVKVGADSSEKVCTRVEAIQAGFKIAEVREISQSLTDDTALAIFSIENPTTTII